MSPVASSGCCCNQPGGGGGGEGCPPGSGKCFEIIEDCCRYTSDEGVIEICDPLDPYNVRIVGGPNSQFTLSLTVLMRDLYFRRFTCGATNADPGEWPNNVCGVEHPASGEAGWQSYNFGISKTVISFVSALFTWRPRNTAKCTDWGWWSVGQVTIMKPKAVTPDASPICGGEASVFECGDTETVECEMLLTVATGVPSGGSRGSWILYVRRTDGADIQASTLVPGYTPSGWSVGAPTAFGLGQACTGVTHGSASWEIADDIETGQDGITVNFSLGADNCDGHWHTGQTTLKSCTTSTSTYLFGPVEARRRFNQFNVALSSITVASDPDCLYTCTPPTQPLLPTSMCDCGSQEDQPKIFWRWTRHLQAWRCIDDVLYCDITTVVRGYWDPCTGLTTITSCIDTVNSEDLPGDCDEHELCSGGAPIDIDLIIGIDPACTSVDGVNKFGFTLGDQFYDLGTLGCPIDVPLIYETSFDHCGGVELDYGEVDYELLLGATS